MKRYIGLSIIAAGVLVALVVNAQVTKPGGGFVPPGKLGGGGGGAGTITGVTAGSGVTGGGTSGTVTVDVGAGSGILVDADHVSIDQAYTQRQVTTSCSFGSFMTAIGSNGTATCTAEPGDITAVNVATGGGLTGGASSGAATVGMLTTCSDQQVLKYTTGTSSWGCAADIDTNTTYTAGTGLQLIGTTFSMNETGGSCSAGSFLSAMSASGVGTCTPEPGDISNVSVTGPITGGGASGSITIGFSETGASCSAGSFISAMSSTGVGTCTAEPGDISAVNVAAGGGLTGGGTSGSVTVGMLTSCSAGQYLSYVGSAWTCTSAGTADNAFYGFGIDGALTFDGSATVLGMVPSSSVYTLNRDIFATTISISTGVTIKTAGYRIFANTSLTFGSSTSKITNNGTDSASSGGGGGGGTGGGATGGGINSIGDVSNTMDGGVGGNVTLTGAAGVSASWNPQGFGGAGGAGGTATAAGGAGGGVTATPTSNGGGWGLTEILSFRVLNQPTSGRFSCGTGGGGGGGGTGGGGNGGGGGGGGGCLFVAAPTITGAGVIQAKGGNGANGGNGATTGGGGGGGGGGGLVVVVTSTLNAPTYTTDVSGGTGGTHGTGGSPANGTAGSAGRAITLDPGSPGNGGSVTGFVSSVTCGTGLTGGTFTSTGTCAIDSSYTQRRVSACAAGQAIQSIAADGTSTCYSADPTFDPKTNTTYFSDFIQIGTASASVSDGIFVSQFSGTSAAVNALTDETGHPGILRLVTGSTATGRASTIVGGTGSESFILGTGEFIGDILVRPGTLCDSSTQVCTVACGLIDSATTADSTDGVYLKFDPAASSNWRTVTENNATKSEADTSPAAAPSANTWQHLGIDVNSAGTSVTFSVGGAAAGTVSTNLPSGAGRAFGFGCMILKSVGTTSRTFDLDYARLDIKGLSR
jgi:hypothetical protein